MPVINHQYSLLNQKQMNSPNHTLKSNLLIPCIILFSVHSILLSAFVTYPNYRFFDLFVWPLVYIAFIAFTRFLESDCNEEWKTFEKENPITAQGIICVIGIGIPCFVAALLFGTAILGILSGIFYGITFGFGVTFCFICASIFYFIER